MSDTKKPKRLAKTNTVRTTNISTATNIQADPQLYIMPYTPKSIVVMGETLNHSNALASLGGKYVDLRIGSGWLFAKFREESVKNYIDTGEVVPYVYSDADRAKFDNTKKAVPNNTAVSGIDEQQLRKMFCEFRSAFEPTEDYEGKAIVDVIYQLEEKYFPSKGTVIKAASKKSSTESENAAEYSAPPTKRLARKNIGGESGGSGESVDEYIAPPTKRLARKNVVRKNVGESKSSIVSSKRLAPRKVADSDGEMESDADTEYDD